jgi:hypothetical protein
MARRGEQLLAPMRRKKEEEKRTSRDTEGIERAATKLLAK